MATLTCKICGSALRSVDQSVITCPQCGTAQVLTRLDEPVRVQLFEQVNRLRREQRFGRGADLCKQLIQSDRNDPEAYWQMCLCKYGIVYEKDARSGQFLPVIYQPQGHPFVSDSDCRAALQCADPAQRAIYSYQACIIDEQIHKKTEQTLLKNKNRWRRRSIACIVVALLLVIALAVGLWNYVLAPYIDYSNAVALMEAGNYEKAMDAFRGLEGYEDISSQIEQCNNLLLEEQYNDALERLEYGDVVEAYETWIALGNYRDSAKKAKDIFEDYKVQRLKQVRVGDTIYLGTYEQNNILTENEALRWRVLDVQDGKALVISEYALDAKRYHDHYTEITWESCTLHSWLNKDFLTAAFTPEEQALISTLPDSGEANTSDRLFLLSADEVALYFPDEGSAACQGTAYAEATGAYVYEDTNNCWWWLRTPGTVEMCASFVDGSGNVRSEGNRYDYGSGAVRPAFWITLDP